MDSTAWRDAPFHQRYGRLLSCSIPCQGFALTDFLAAAEGQPRCYWESQSEPVAFAGAGAAVELMGWGDERYSRIERDARELFADAHIAAAEPAGPRLFGGFAFRADFTPDNTWAIYTPAFFILPHYQCQCRGGDMWLTINTQIPLDESPESLIPDLQRALRHKAAQLRAGAGKRGEARQSALLGVDYPMRQAAWRRMVTQAASRIEAGELKKVVLARAAELRFAGRVQLLPVLRHLAAHYSECYRFLFEPRPYYAFYGASPELLASLREHRLESVALAGSIGRGANPAADRQLGRQLLASPKDRREHQIVVDKMRERLAPLCRSLSIAPTSLLRLSNIQHLQAAIRAELRREHGILRLVAALHPTPALGGHPRERAMDMIRALEPLPRGWYGAPVGWIDAQLNGQFAVAIRSAVAQESRAWIYAGAGIVAGSQPQSEWDETELKFRPMLDAHCA